MSCRVHLHLPLRSPLRQEDLKMIVLLLLLSFLTSVSSLVAQKRAAPRSRIEIEANQGTLVRWSGPATKSCVMKRRSWKPIHGVCYYPIDLEEKPGRVPIARVGAQR